jgi:three-Cys-motif partner protein
LQFLFIEEREDRAASLRAAIDRLAHERQDRGTPIPDWVHYRVEQAEFAPTMSQLLDDLDSRGAHLAPTFCFIDPFGFSGVPMSLIGRIARNPQCECFVNFAFDSVQRFLDHPDELISAHFEELFGNPDWSVVREVQKERWADAIIELYRTQFRQVGGFSYPWTFQMLNATNRTIYYLNFGTNNLTGLSKMKQAMWAADPGGGQRFSDRTAHGQMVLFDASPRLDVLKGQLQDEFRGRGVVPIEQIVRFVLVGTTFSEAKHLRRGVLLPMERVDPPEIRVVPLHGTNRRRGNYPPGTGIEFL